MAASIADLPLRHAPRFGSTVGVLLKNDPLALSLFLALLLIGADRFAIRPGGLTLRVVFPVLIMAFSFLYMRLNKSIVFDKPLALLFFAWGLAGAASSVGSYD